MLQSVLHEEESSSQLKSYKACSSQGMLHHATSHAFYLVNNTTDFQEALQEELPTVTYSFNLIT